jgi:hypothetical protein
VCSSFFTIFVLKNIYYKFFFFYFEGIEAIFCKNHQKNKIKIS